MLLILPLTPLLVRTLLMPPLTNFLNATPNAERQDLIKVHSSEILPVCVGDPLETEDHSSEMLPVCVWDSLETEGHSSEILTVCVWDSLETEGHSSEILPVCVGLTRDRGP